MFFVLLIICNEYSCEYILDNWKRFNVCVSYFVFFLKYNGYFYFMLVEIWELYKFFNSENLVENLCINSYFEFFSI